MFNMNFKVADPWWTSCLVYKTSYSPSVPIADGPWPRAMDHGEFFIAKSLEIPSHLNEATIHLPCQPEKPSSHLLDHFYLQNSIAIPRPLQPPPIHLSSMSATGVLFMSLYHHHPLLIAAFPKLLTIINPPEAHHRLAIIYSPPPDTTIFILYSSPPPVREWEKPLSLPSIEEHHHHLLPSSPPELLPTIIVDCLPLHG